MPIRRPMLGRPRAARRRAAAARTRRRRGGRPARRRRPPSCSRGPSCDEQAVAGVMAERVVELLEAVEVDHRDRERRVAGRRAPRAGARGTGAGWPARSARRSARARASGAARCSRGRSAPSGRARARASRRRARPRRRSCGGSGRARAGRRRRARARVGVTSVRQPSSTTLRGGVAGLQAAAAISSGEISPSSGTHSGAPLADEARRHVADVGDHVREQTRGQQHPDGAHAPAAQRHGDEHHHDQQHVAHRVRERDDARPAAAGRARRRPRRAAA